MRPRWLKIGVLAACAGFCLVAPAARAADVGRLTPDVIFTRTTPLASGPELLRRMSSPLVAAEVQRMLARSGQTLNPQSINLADERFVTYLPSGPPPAKGYGLLVFVPPWETARLPPGWAPALNKAKVIYVSAARSGNGANIIGRRAPLALIGAENIMRLYPVDPERVYVGGFSGGSRVAMRLALAYPDLFRGALLTAGSDPIGDADTPLPPADLLRLFQDRSQLVYATGGQDLVNVEADEASQRAMRDWCVFDVADDPMPDAGHQIADPVTLSRALGQLDHPRPTDQARLAACRSGVDQRLQARLRSADTLIAAGRKAEAQRLLLDIGRRFGGLAAPAILTLWNRCDCAVGGG